MSELPDRVYITEPKTYSDGEPIPGTWVTKRDWCFKHEYRRADLPPTLSAAMELPEVKAMKDALERQVEHMAFLISRFTLSEKWYEKFTIDMEQDRATLAAIKETKT